MKYESQELLTEFYELIQEEHPELSFEQVKEICFGPWLYLKEQMSTGDLRDVRFEYFGVFKVLPGRVEHFRRKNTEKFNDDKMSIEDFNRYEEMFERYYVRKDSEVKGK